MEHKVTRLCWNTEKWQRPTGAQGKSKNRRAFEQENAFGMEEWLFDTSRVIDGYHYGYVQGVARHREKYIGKTFDLSVYTIDDRTKERWWFGKVKNVEVVGYDESAEVIRIYKKRGWLAQMREELKLAGASVEVFDREIKPEAFAILKYSIEDLDLLTEPVLFKHDDIAVKSDYYNLKQYIGSPAVSTKEGRFVFKGGHNPAAARGRVIYAEHDRQCNDFHSDIQTVLYNRLAKQFGKKNVQTEVSTGMQTRVDLVVKENERYALYEIKAGLTLQSCVREALGQLLEYRYAIGSDLISRLVIVSHHKLNEAVGNYLEFLRTKHSLPVEYLQCLQSK